MASTKRHWLDSVDQLLYHGIGSVPIRWLAGTPLRPPIMSTNPPDSLPSTVEETLAICPKFRILVVGNTGVGKSSLVSNVFNISIKDIDIAHDRVGDAKIAREYTSETNPRFILHDSQGFEPGSLETREVAEEFIRNKCGERLEPKDRLHAIWLCIETPCTGSRLMQTGDEKVLALATELKVAVIIAFTKYDVLFNEYHRKAARRLGKLVDAHTITTDAEARAKSHLDQLIIDFRKRSSQSFEYVTVSTHKRYPGRIDMLKRLTETTRKCLHEVEGELWVPWAAAQKINAEQKVNFSIDEGFKKYWINLGKSTVFQGHSLSDCLLRIHLDIVEAWTFYDPEKLLSGEYFCKEMVKLIEPLLTQPGSSISEAVSTLSGLTSIAGAVATSFAPVLSGVGIAAVAVNFLYEKYQAIPSTALCLGAYIVDLTLILHNLFVDILVQEPPRLLNMELIQDALKNYKDFDSRNIHRLIGDIVSGSRALDPKEKIVDLIRRQLKMERE